jgi:hypothetical protein
MSDRRTDAATRRPRLGVLAVVVALALIVGIALMIYAVQRSGGWFIRQPDQTATTPTRAATYTPPQPTALSPQTQAIDPSALAARESGLAAQLTALEARAAAVSLDAQGAAGQAQRAELLLIAAAARRAIEAGTPLGSLEDSLRTRFGPLQPRAVTALIASAHQPVTLASLRTAFDARAGQLQAGGDTDWLSSLSRELRTLVVVHDEATPSPLPSARVARARRLLDAGQVQAAIAEAQRLPGAASARDWFAAADRYLRTRAALDTIEAAALTVPVAVTPPAAVPNSARSTDPALP